MLCVFSESSRIATDGRHIAMKIPSLRAASFLLWIVLLVQPAGDLVAAGPDAVRHKIVAGDSIRGLILGANCVTSMSDYVRAREAFAGKNPEILHSGLLVPGAVVAVPVLTGPRGKGCLSFREQRVVRVEYEGLGSAERVLVQLDGPLLPEVFTLDKASPVRVVCDFDGALPEAGMQRELDTGGRLIRKVRVGHEDKPFKRARVVLDVDDSVAGRIEREFVEQESLFIITVHEAGRD